ncbi:ATP-dependent zinc metalloprotease FtsH [archaeon BMS3Bbin15]|nr:ATP-dependent zinc metalloprotease FtsH [archaeon BMS3Bbin15]
MQVELKVAEAMQNDVGRGIIRLDTKTREILGISTGDIVEIDGKRKTVAIVWRAYAEDEGLGIIRMDGILRQNAEVSLGETVSIKKAEAKDVKKVTISPNQAIRFSAGFGDFIKRRLLGRPLIKGDKIVVGVLGTTLPFTVTQTYPSGIVKVTDKTQIIVKEEPMREKAGIPSIAYEDIGGLKDEVQKIRELIELPMKHPELFEHLGIEPPKGVLLHGPPGTGKTLIARAVANETNAFFIPLNGPEIMSKFYGESEENLRKVFKEGEDNAPSIIFIDELDAIAPKREEVHGEVERRVVAQLLSLMDGLKSRGRVVVIGATNRPDTIDPALRRPGRFDREIIIGVPDRNARKEILQIHTRGMPLTEDVDLDEFADITHGFVGADLEALCKEAAMNTLRRILPEIDLEEETVPPDILESLEVTKEDFKEAWKSIEPSALREVYVEVPNIKWEDIGGLSDIKAKLREAVEWPIKYPEAFVKLGIKPTKGILLFGPPGTGKTMLAKAVANETDANFINVKGPEVLSKWVGESEKTMREIFKKAKHAAPTVVFFDEIDAIASTRSVEAGTRVSERVLNQLLTEMDGLEELHNVLIIAATNRPDILDPALIRPGRFDKILLVQAPDEKARREIFKVHTRGMPLKDDVNLKELAKETESFSGADIEALCREAALLAMKEAIKNENENLDDKNVERRHFKKALKHVRPSTTPEMIKSYEQFLRRYESRELEKLVYMA